MSRTRAHSETLSQGEHINFQELSVSKDKVCSACYKSHLITIKNSMSKVESTDIDHSSLLDRLRQQLPQDCDVHTIDQALHYGATIAAIHVGEALLKQTAVLLPEAYEIFCDIVNIIIITNGIYHHYSESSFQRVAKKQASFFSRTQVYE